MWWTPLAGVGRAVREIARHRDVLFWLATKEIKVRYKLPLLGFLWTLLVPLSVSAILWLVFTYVMPIQLASRPFFLFLLAGVFPWNAFAQSVSHSTTSLLDAGALIRKTPFPRVLIPLSIITANLFNFLLALTVVIAVVLASGWSMTRWLGLLPLIIGLQLMLTIGVVLVVADLQVRYRDIKYLTEVGLLLWFYLTPIFYPLDFIAHLPAAVQWLYLLNPFVGIVELYRLALLGSLTPNSVIAPSTLVSLAVASSAGILVLGVAMFQRHEASLADWVTE